ncbi:MAG: thioredoxin domain-containing protein [Promethearchaeota archaeon]
MEYQGNKLKNQSSPYLLQHANNPVHWYPWSEEAFQKAKLENKPIFLSIGYSTCHWCHVMAHESFEDIEVARILNEAFVSIKVDREERPDVDGVYMTVCQIMTGSGGWPLTIIMTPDKKPFFAGTYFPKETRLGRMGLVDLLQKVKLMWNQQKGEILRSASQISFALQDIDQESPGYPLERSVLKKAYLALKSRFDERHGGFGERPKFPSPHNLVFLLRYWKRTGEEKALNMVKATLKAMRKGGIYDQLGFGIHRYSTDLEWLVPHFEKMLYDQALVAIACVETFQASNQSEFLEMAREIFTYVSRDMTSNEGAFYSAEDADSEGEEGKFYLWSKKEIEEVLTKAEAELAIKFYGVKEEGNYLEEATRIKTGRNILHLNKNTPELSKELGVDEEKLRNELVNIREKLFHHRKKRIHPHKDDKILTDWNGLMIVALAKAYQVAGDDALLKMAENAINFVNSQLRITDGRLLHRYREGRAEINGYLTDYAFIIWGLIELYEATFNVEYLELAIKLHDLQVKYFWDENIGGFYFTATDAEDLLIRKKNIYDGAIPSGNSVALQNLLRLGLLTGDYKLEKKADILGRVFSENVSKNPSAYAQLLIAVDLMIGPTFSLVIAGDDDSPDTITLINSIRKHYIPNKSLIHRNTSQSTPEIDKYASFIRSFVKSENKATAYACIDKTCKPATQEFDKLVRLLDSRWN